MSTAPRFTERAAHERGFAEIFDAQIAPALGRVERQRRRILRKFWLRVGAGGSVTLALAATGFGAAAGLPSKLEFALIVLVVGTIGTLMAVDRLRKTYRRALRRILVPPAAMFMKVAYQRNPGFRTVSLHRSFVEAGILPRGCTSKAEDCVKGEHRGTAFEMVELTLTRRLGRASYTAFAGVVLDIAVPRSFSCTLLLDRRGARAWWAWLRLLGTGPGGKTAALIETGDAAFDRRFDALADDPVEAAALLTPAFRRTMRGIVETFPTARGLPLFPVRHVTAAFTNGRFYLALPIGGRRFEVGSLLRSAYACEEDVRRLLADIAIARQVIDRLHGAAGP